MSMKPTLFTHELLDHEGKPNGVMLGCADRTVVVRAYDEGHTSEQIREWYSAEQVAELAEQRAGLLEALRDYLEAQDALDNRETAGPNAEDYFELMRRRNNAREDLDAAIARATKESEQ